MSVPTTEMVGKIKAWIEHDLLRFEDGKRDGFKFLKYAGDYGMVAMHYWYQMLPECEKEWGQFMSGQSVCASGIYVRDVRRFLNAIG